jgi:hypothetical protein
MALDPIIIPAQPGWFVASVDQHDKLNKDEIVAWGVVFNRDEGIYEARAISYNTGRNSLCDHAAGYVIIAPHGQIVPANRRCKDKGKIFASEEEAAAWCRKEIAAEARQVGIVHHRNDYRPPLRVIDKDKPPENE